MIEVHDLRRTSPVTVEAWADRLSANLRKSDIEEVRASSGQSPHEAVYASLSLSSMAYAVESAKHGIVSMFGAAPHPLPGIGVVWMLGTDGIIAESYSIARATRRYLDELNGPYMLLWNYIDVRNAVSMRWLRWGGFKLLATHENFGPEGRTFHTFARMAHDV